MQTQAHPNFFYFPLKIKIVDDDVDYLAWCKERIKSNYVEITDKPLDIIDTLKPINIDIKDFIKEYINNIFSLDYSAIANYVNEVITSDKFGILIADYKMPGLNGIELCSKFENTNLLKILLTGEYQVFEAIESLNNKEIDYYIDKSNGESIVHTISKLQIKFFNQLTNNICKMIDKEDLSFLNDNDYVTIFNDTIQKNNIISYYLLNNYGCYRMSNGTTEFIFSIYNSADLFEIAQEVPEHKKHDVEQGNLIPSYLSNEYTKNKLINAQKNGSYSYCIEKIV